MADRDPILTCRGVTKRYGSTTVLQDIGLDLYEGDVFGFLGPNGAGKTTLIKILLGLVTPNAGEVRIFGRDLFTERKAIMKQVGAIVEAPMFFEYLTAFENLRSLVSLNGKVPVDRIREALAVVGLGDVSDRTVRTFSYGMKQRLGIAQALLPENRFVILDEPTNGLDPHGIAGMRRLVRNLSRERGITVFVSSHLLTEVEQICDRIMIINRGQTVLETRVDELSSRAAASVHIVMKDDPGVQQKAVELGGESLDPENGHAVFLFQADGDETGCLVRALVEAGAEIRAVQPRHATLEDVFLRETADGSCDVRTDAFRD